MAYNFYTEIFILSDHEHKTFSWYFLSHCRTVYFDKSMYLKKLRKTTKLTNHYN